MSRDITIVFKETVDVANYFKLGPEIVWIVALISMLPIYQCIT